jgi:hypothetical protein
LPPLHLILAALHLPGFPPVLFPWCSRGRCRLFRQSQRVNPVFSVGPLTIDYGNGPLPIHRHKKLDPALFFLYTFGVFMNNDAVVFAGG